MLASNVSLHNRPRRRVSIRQDGGDFVVVFLAENLWFFEITTRVHYGKSVDRCAGILQSIAVSAAVRT